MAIHPNAGKPPQPSDLVDVAKLVTAYFTEKPDPLLPTQRVAFGTSGHRGSSLDASFNEDHILAITQAICLYRREKGYGGPLYLGIDTHALSEPALTTALEVLAANDVDVRVDAAGGYTPTPVVSHAILTHNTAHPEAVADGIVITPSHNPPKSGGFKYNPPNGGPADTDVTKWIEEKANAFLANNLSGVRRVPYAKARRAGSVKPHPYLDRYVADLPSVVDLEAIRASGLKLGVDPLGGASVAYWAAIGERHKLDLDVVNPLVDPTFRFMTLDWDGQIRMDPSSVYAMARMVSLRDRFDVAFANDADADRHGIVTRGRGLLEPNHYLSAAIAYLFANRPGWPPSAGIGKTLVSSAMIDRVAGKRKRTLVEVPVGFKWFVDGLLSGTLGFGGEESAGASFLRRDGSVWTTDKDGIAPNLLAAEISAKTGRDPGELYGGLAAEFGAPVYRRVDAAATPDEKARLARLSPESVSATILAGEPVTAKLTRAPGNGAPIGGLKVVAPNGWFAARPSGTENIYKIYAESFQGREHLERILAEAQSIVDAALALGSIKEIAR